MHKYSFPKCPVKGSREPVEYSHGMSGRIPKKCSECDNLFEGSCRRSLETLGRYMLLDYGPCHISGETFPVIYECKFYIGKAEIPQKCSKCACLKVNQINGFYCGLHQKDTWRYFPRTLDWGTWSPDRPYVTLGPEIKLSEDIINFVEQDKQIEMIKEFRKLNPEKSIQEAKEAYTNIQTILNQ